MWDLRICSSCSAEFYLGTDPEWCPVCGKRYWGSVYGKHTSVRIEDNGRVIVNQSDGNERFTKVSAAIKFYADQMLMDSGYNKNITHDAIKTILKAMDEGR